MTTTPESRYTPPSSWCQHPEWWTADPADPESSEREVTALVTALVYAVQPEIAVETGTASGATALEIGRALQSSGHGRLWTLEIDEKLAGRAAERLRGLPVTAVHADSLSWWPPEPIDFAWIDSGAAVVRVSEIRRWRSMFRSGAIIGVHDTAPNMGREVLTAELGHLLAEFRWQSVTLRTPRGVTLIQVP